MSETIKVKFLGEERTLYPYDGAEDSGVFAALIAGAHLEIWTDGADSQASYREEIGYGKSPQEATDELTGNLRPLAEALVTISGGRLCKRNPWEMLREIGDALEPMVGTAQDVDHVLECHAEQLPDYFRAMCKAVEKAHHVVCMNEEEMDELELVEP